MKKLKRDCCFVLLMLVSTTLKAEAQLSDAIFGVGSFYSSGEWGEQVSFGVEFEHVMTGYLDYQSQGERERLALTLDRQIPLNNELSLVASVGSSVWLKGDSDKTVTFEPLVGIGLRYDWSPYIATSLSYQYVFSNDGSEFLEPSIDLGFVFTPFVQPSHQVAFESQENRTVDKKVEHSVEKLSSSCEVGVFIRSFYFDHNKFVANINSTDITQLQLPDKGSITLVGHTDSTGRAEYNNKFGLKRADFVKKAIINNGGNQPSITLCSRGEESANKQEGKIGDWTFRRVDIYLDDE